MDWDRMRADRENGKTPRPDKILTQFTTTVTFSPKRLEFETQP